MLKTVLRTHTCGELGEKKYRRDGDALRMIDSLRDHGGLAFIDLRDRYGKTQPGGLGGAAHAFGRRPVQIRTLHFGPGQGRAPAAGDGKLRDSTGSVEVGTRGRHGRGDGAQ